MESNTSKNEINQILQENIKLRAELQLLKGKRTVGNTISKFISRQSTNFLVGKGLKKSLFRLFEELPRGKVTKVTLADVSSHLIWRITRVGIVALMIGIVPLFILGIQTYILNSQNQLLQYQNKRLDQQINLQEGNRRSSLIFLMSNIMDKIGEELKSPKNNKRILSDELIGRVVSLSQAFRPYRYLENDELINRPLSPERGQLLLALSNSLLDEATYDKLFAKADFSYADLKNAKFKDTYLEGVELQDANFKGAIFQDADLDYTDFSGANMEDVIFDESYMNGIKLINTNLKGSKLINVKMADALLKNADFSNAEISGDFRRCNLDGIILSNVSVGFLDFEGAEIQNPKMMLLIDTTDITGAFEITGSTYLNENFVWKKRFIQTEKGMDSLFYIARKTVSNLSIMENCGKKAIEIIKSSRRIKEIERTTKKKKDNLLFLVEANPFGDKSLDVSVDSIYRYRMTTEDADPLSTISWIEFDPKNKTLKEMTFKDTISLTFNKSLLKSFSLNCQ